MCNGWQQQGQSWKEVDEIFGVLSNKTMSSSSKNCQNPICILGQYNMSGHLYGWWGNKSSEYVSGQRQCEWDDTDMTMVASFLF